MSIDDGWGAPLADHTMTPAEVRAAFAARITAGCAELRRQLRAEGLPATAVERGVGLAEGAALARLDADLPAILADLARSAGTAPTLHLVS